MSPKEAAANAMLLLVAGHDSTVNTITNCVLMLLRNPESFDLVRRRPELIPRAIEEVQRLQSAVQFFPSRSATADIEIGGTSSRRAQRCTSCTARPTATRPGSRTRTISTPNGRTTSTSVGAAASTPAWAVRWRAWRSTSRWRPSCAACENPRLVVDPPPYRQSQIFRGPRHLLVDFDLISD